MQKRMEFRGDHSAGARLRTGITVSEPGAIIGANAGELRDIRLHLAPGKICIAKAGIKDDRGAAVSGAVDVHLAASYVDQLSVWWVEAAVARLGNVFVKEPGRGERESQEQEVDKDAAQPRTSRSGR